MTDTISNWWAALSRRERWLVGTAAVLAALTIGWFGIINPLINGLAEARSAHNVAVERHAGIMARVATAERLGQNGGAPAAGVTGRVDLVISQSAAEQGFTLSRNDAQGDDAASIAIGSARAAALFGWLGTLESQGLIASELSIRPNANGTVGVTATFRRVR
jgi:general secretion pathway protein M